MSLLVACEKPEKGAKVRCMDVFVKCMQFVNCMNQSLCVQDRVRF